MLGKTGRPPKPTALKVLEGNPGNRPLNEKEPEPDKGMPEAPPELDPLALEEWNRRGPGLVAMGVLTTIDTAVFAAYCQAYADWRHARESLRALKATLPPGNVSGAFLSKTGQGGLKKSPLVTVANECAFAMIRFAAELGMTPSARARLEVIPVEDSRDKEFDELLFSAKKSS